MSKKHAITLSFLIIFIIFLLFIIINSFGYGIKVKEVDLKQYLEMHEENNYIPDVGYINDARTAAVIGGSIIDNLCNKTLLHIGHITVGYDAENRLWKVSKGYLFEQGAFVIIKQDTGEILKALYYK